MIIDLVYLYDELDLLEIRLNTYDPYVDLFIVVEATSSFAGKRRKILLENERYRFAKWWNKIVLYKVEDFPKDHEIIRQAISNSNIGMGEHYWIREFYIKESARRALSPYPEDAVVFISDIDEFWDPRKLTKFLSVHPNQFVRPDQKAIYYYFNNRCSEINGWTGTVVGRLGDIKKNCLNDIRTRHKTKCIEVTDGGWHFGFIVGLDGKSIHENKMVRWEHPAYQNWIQNFSDNVRNNVDYRGREYSYWKEDYDLPEYLVRNKSKYHNSFM